MSHSSHLYRNALDPNKHDDFEQSTLPGAQHIPGDDIPCEFHEEDRESSFSSHESSEHHGLPTELVQTEQEGIEVGSELVIEGVVVLTTRKKRRKEYMVLILTIIVTIATTAFFVPRAQSSFNFKYSSIQPSLSPTHTFSPTTAIDYEAYVKYILMNISGEDLLYNTSSVQHKIFRLIVEDMPRYERESILNVNETKAIIQRYVMGVIGLSASRLSRMPFEQLDKQLVSFPSTCELPFLVCNDNKDIVMLFMQNEWMTSRGGGILATEIGELKALTHLILSRSALHGSIPTEIGKLKHLQYLDLHDNEFTGSIPTEISELYNMEMMFVQSNNLMNNIPSELGNNLSRFFYIDLSQNMLDGSVPIELGDLNDLKGLKLHGNSLTGSVDFLCNKNMTTSYDIEVHLGAVGIIQKTLDLGLSIDCLGELRIPQCSCCRCG